MPKKSPSIPQLPEISLVDLPNLSSENLAKLLNFLTEERAYFSKILCHDKAPDEPLIEKADVGSKDGVTGDCHEHVNNTYITNANCQNNITLIDLLKNKIEEGVFGLCEECEEPISQGRLLARRFLVLKCVKCKSVEEKQNGGGKIQGQLRQKTCK